jgi:nucleotide-binding universal stress UspA family protein
MELKTLLVPCDFSPYAEHALTWAVKLATQSQARIILLYAVPIFARISYTEVPVLMDIPKIEAELVAEGETQLRKFIAEHNTGHVSVEPRARLGDPFAVICRAAEEDPVDLIVMGSHGRTGLSHVFLGSVAERVVRHAPCPVLVARLPQAATQGA